jgi:hypothetical protein
LSFVLGAFVLGGGGILFACSNGESAIGDNADGGGTGDGGGTTADGSVSPGDDAGTTAADGGASLCEVTMAYEIGCGRSADLTCGDAGFLPWCAQNDKIINSATFDKAELACLTQDNCTASKHHDCDYRTYGTATPTAAQAAMVAAYCQTCEPKDTAGCATRQTTYNPGAGPSSVSDVFVAAWELADPLVDQIRAKCTGPTLDAGADAGTAACAKAFSTCSGGIFVDALPNCVK